MHSLRTVFAWRPTILVDALGLAFSTTNACTTSPEGGGAHDARRHDGWCRGLVSAMVRKGEGREEASGGAGTAAEWRVCRSMVVLMVDAKGQRGGSHAVSLATNRTEDDQREAALR